VNVEPFHFRDAVRLNCPTGLSAATLREFRNAIDRLEPPVLHHHLRELPLRFTFTFWDYPNDFAVWAANALRLSVALTLLGFGTLLRALDRRRQFVSLDFGRVGRIFFILLFAITAARLDLRLLPAGAATAAALIAARYAGKSLGVFAFARRASGVGASFSSAFLAASTSTWAHSGWL